MFSNISKNISRNQSKCPKKIFAMETADNQVIIIWSTYFNDRGGVRQRFIFYVQKNPKSTKKVPTFLAYLKKSHTNSKLQLCYCCHDLS